MGKTADQRNQSLGAARPAPAGGPSPAPPPPGDEALRQRAALAEFFRRKEEAWANMTPAERDQAEREWHAFKRSMNESRVGGRVPYPD